MAVYCRMIRPVLIPPALHGCSCKPDPIDDWYDEDDVDDEMIEEWREQVSKKDNWASLRFQEKYEVAAGDRFEVGIY